MSLATNGMMSREWQNCDKRRNVHQKYRSHLIRLLGWEKEYSTPGVVYAATTGELRQWVHEKYNRKPI